jgi:hypothetical protein
MKRLVPTTSAALAAVLLSLIGSATPASASPECTDAVKDATQEYFDTILAARTRVAITVAGGGTASSIEEERAAKAALLAAVRAACKTADLDDFEAGSCGGQNPTLRKTVNCIVRHSKQAANYVLASIFDRPIPATPTPRPTPKPTTTTMIMVVTPTPTPTRVPQTPGPPRQTMVNGPCQSRGFGDCAPGLTCAVAPNGGGRKICVPTSQATPRSALSPASATPAATGTPAATNRPPTPRPPTATPRPSPTPALTASPRPSPSPTPCSPGDPTPLECFAMGGSIDPDTGCCIFP